MPIVLAIHGNTLYSANPPVVLPPLANLVPPSFAVIPLLPGQVSAITGGTWNRAVDATRTWRIYTDQNLVIPYAQLTGTSVSYTPEQDGNSFLLAQTGLSSLIGHNVYIDEIVSINGVAQPASPKSTAYLVLSAVPLTAVAAQASQSFLINQAITTTQPVTRNGGTPPFTWAISPAPASGLAFAAASGNLSGTATVLENGVAHAVTVTDVVGNQAQASYTEFVTASSVQVLDSIHAANTFASMSGYVQTLGGSQSLSGVSESLGIRSTDISPQPSNLYIAGPYGNTLMRFGKITDPDPAKGGRSVLLVGANSTDPQTFTHIGRCETGTNQGLTTLNKSGTTYWFAFEIYIPSSRWAQGAGNIFQLHSNGTSVNLGGPLAFLFGPAGRVATNACVALAYYVSTDGSGNSYTQQFPYFSDNVADGGSGPYPQNAWVKWVIKYRGSTTGTSADGLLSAWMDGTQAFTPLTGINMVDIISGATTDYPKCGFDDFQNGGGSAGTYQLIRSWHVVQDNGSYTESQIRALLT